MPTHDWKLGWKEIRKMSVVNPKFKFYKYFYGNPKYGWDGAIVTAFVFNLHDWRIDNEPWTEISKN